MRLAGGQARRRRPDLALRAEDDRREQVVVQVLADTGQICDHVDSQRAEMRCGPDAGEKQKLRRADRAPTHDDLRRVRRLDVLPLRPFHSGATRAVEQETPRGRPGDEFKLRSCLDRPEVRSRGAVADAVLDAVLHERDAVLRRTVVVAVQRDPALLCSLGDRRVDRIGLERREQADRSGRARLAPLDALVDRPDVIPGPSVGAEIGPRVEVLGRASHPDHRVQTARPAEHAAARPGEPAVVRVHLRHGLVRPILLGQPKLVEPAGIVDRRVLVAAAGLEQEDVGAAVDETASDDATGGPGADDDGVRAANVHVNQTQTLLTSV
jgi:hypothetical protein